MSNNNENECNVNYESITIKVEHPEYGPMQTSTTVSQLSSMKLFSDDSVNSYLKTDVYNKIIGEDPVIDFIENSIDKFLVAYQKDKCITEKLSKGAERQRLYRQNESEMQREKRLEMARRYIKRRRDNETDEQRFERLKKQRERIRTIRQARKMNPELDKIRRKIEAERMKIRRASETPIQRMIRLEKSREYSKRRRENEGYRKQENEKNRLAHQMKRSDMTFRLQERQRDKLRKKIKNDMNFQQLPISLCSVDM